MFARGLIGAIIPFCQALQLGGGIQQVSRVKTKKHLFTYMRALNNNTKR